MRKFGYSIWFLCLILVSACTQETKQPQVEQDKVAISFEELESLVDAQPKRFVSNPDSFLSSYHLNPSDTLAQEIYAYTLTSMAFSIREYGDLYNSIRYYEKALAFIQVNQVQEFDIPLYIYKPLAALYTQIDDNEKAINLLENLAYHKNDHLSQEQLGILNNLANAYIYKGDYTKAENLLLRIISATKDKIFKALLYNTLSKVYTLQENLEQSDRYNQQALTIFQKSNVQGDSVLWYVSALTQYGENHKSLGHIILAQQTINKHFPNSQNREKASIQLLLGNLYYAKKEYTNSIVAYAAVMSGFKKVESKYALDYKYTQALIGMGKSLESTDQLDSAFHYFEWAIENDFRVQQVITSAEDQLRNNIWNKEILENLIRIYHQLAPENQNDERTKTLLWCVELNKARLLINEINRSEQWTNSSTATSDAMHRIRNLYQQVDQSPSDELKQHFGQQISRLKSEFQLSEKYFEWIRYTPSKTRFFEVLASKPVSFYSYYIHQDGQLSILTKTDDKYQYEQANSSLMDSIVQFKKDYFSSSPNFYNQYPKEYERRSLAILRVLLPNLVRSSENVFVSLDGALYGLPFDALYQNDFLINHYNFAYLNSFLLFDYLTPKEKEQSTIAIFFRSKYKQPLPDLPYVDAEIRNISKHFQTNHIAPDLQNDSVLKTEFNHSNIIHIAAHTILDSAEAPVIVLKNPISTSQLRFFDIKSPLVFLSACNTGQGLPLPSEGTESIQRVFLSKNIPSVISTYWFANDAAMLSLTSSFYDELYRSANPMESLAAAKRKYLDQAGNQQRNPWYWANINYTGIGNEIGLKKSPDLFFIGLLIGFLILLLGSKKYLLRFYRSMVDENKVANNKMK